MDLNEEVWSIISESVKMPEESKRTLHINIMRIFEKSLTTVGKKHNVTIMTQEASAAGDKGNPPSAAIPKTL